MLKVGLTGSIGSGKSLVGKIVESLGIDVFYADAVAKMLLDDAGVKSDIIKAFGEKILDDDHRIVKSRLASVVFNHPPSLSALNAIIHPSVRLKFYEWIARDHPEGYVVLEAAILFESGFHRECDEVIVVSAPEEIRIERVMERDRVTREEVLSRIRNQWSDEEKARHADYVIINDSQRLVIPQVLKIHEKLMQKQPWKH